MAEGVPCLNDRAWALADELTARAPELGAVVHHVANARVIDAGVKAIGSIGAGLMLARICMADLATATVQMGQIGDRISPFVTVHTHHPVPACMASQYAGWQICLEDYFAMGSGPMRAAYGKETLYEHIGFRERPTRAVGVLETSTLPDEAAIAHIAERARVPPTQLTLATARTASLAGGVQIAARSVETAMHKLHELGFDLSRIVGGFGAAPLPPVAADDMAAIGRTNDAVLYGATVTLYLIGEDQSLETFGPKLPSSASKDYGLPFGEVFERYDHDFYKIDPMLFSPAQVCLNNIETGRARWFGQTDHALLKRSFFNES